MRYMWCKAARRRFSLSLTMVSLASPIGSGYRLIEVMRKFVHEMVFSDDRAADNDVDAAVDDIREQAIKCFIRLCNFVKES